MTMFQYTSLVEGWMIGWVVGERKNRNPALLSNGGNRGCLGRCQRAKDQTVAMCNCILCRGRRPVRRAAGIKNIELRSALLWKRQFCCLHQKLANIRTRACERHQDGWGAVHNVRGRLTAP